jgi:hypothetical protein
MWLTMFIISTLINVFFLLYVRWLLMTVTAINEDIEGVGDLIRDFSSHLKTVHDLEMFYGDETLASLMQHAKELTDRLGSIDLILQEEVDSEEEAETSD